ncbi:MAG: hypothetical protein J1F36_03995 [Clostridiales bacterium]|nr:hypothetical protein [Clostridiales bacterium]
MEKQDKIEELTDKAAQNEQLTKEQILECYRKENKNGDERSKKNEEVANKVRNCIFIVFLLAVYTVEHFICKQYEFLFAYLATCLGVTGSAFLTKGILNKTKSTIIIGVVETLMAIVFFILFILRLLGVV